MLILGLAISLERILYLSFASTNVNKLLKILTDKKASDLHITANSKPKIRIDEKLFDADDVELSPIDTKELAYSLLTKEQIASFEKNLELDFSF